MRHLSLGRSQVVMTIEQKSRLRKTRGKFGSVAVCSSLFLATGCGLSYAQNALTSFGQCITFYSNLRLPGGFLAYPASTSVAICGNLLDSPQSSTRPTRYSRAGTSEQTYMADRWQCYQQSRGSCGAWASCLYAHGYQLDPTGKLVAPSAAMMRCTP